jgi:hypothetical protein
MFCINEDKDKEQQQQQYELSPTQLNSARAERRQQSLQAYSWSQNLTAKAWEQQKSCENIQKHNKIRTKSKEVQSPNLSKKLVKVYVHVHAIPSPNSDPIRTTIEIWFPFPSPPQFHPFALSWVSYHTKAEKQKPKERVKSELRKAAAMLRQ